MPDALVWAEPLSRGDLKLAPGDIPDSIDWFKEKTGQAPKLITLCPKNEKFAREIPEGISVEYCDGMFRGEVWLSGDGGQKPISEKATTETSTNPPKTHYNQNLRVSKIKKHVLDIPQNYETSKQGFVDTNNALPVPSIVNKRGRPQKSGKLSRITRWRRQRENPQLELPIGK